MVAPSDTSKRTRPHARGRRNGRSQSRANRIHSTGESRRFEHWVIRSAGGQLARALNMLQAGESYADVPYFWGAP